MQDAAIRASWKSFLALRHLYGDKCSSVGWETPLRRLQQGTLDCIAAALQAWLTFPGHTVEVAALQKIYLGLTLLTVKALKVLSAFTTLRDTNTHDRLRVRTNESATVRCSGSRSESLMQLCNTTLFVFPSWPHCVVFFFNQLPACFTSRPHLDVR